MRERSFDRAASFVAEVDDVGCRQFVESEVAAISVIISGHECNLWVEGQQCIEKKLSFAFNGDGIMSYFFEAFLAKIAALHALRHSKGAVNFLGVIMDDLRQQVKSCFAHGNEFGTVSNILYMCNVAGIRIPWSIRLQWARDIISAMADIHPQSLVDGRDGTWNPTGVSGTRLFGETCAWSSGAGQHRRSDPEVEPARRPAP